MPSIKVCDRCHRLFALDNDIHSLRCRQHGEHWIVKGQEGWNKMMNGEDIWR